jgi:hypothetical protein
VHKALIVLLPLFVESIQCWIFTGMFFLFYSGEMSLLGSGLLSYSNVLMSCDDANVHLIPAYECQANGHHPGNYIVNRLIKASLLG